MWVGQLVFFWASPGGYLKERYKWPSEHGFFGPYPRLLERCCGFELRFSHAELMAKSTREGRLGGKRYNSKSAKKRGPRGRL
jgi:hypothetical protein